VIVHPFHRKSLSKPAHPQAVGVLHTKEYSPRELSLHWKEGHLNQPIPRLWVLSTPLGQQEPPYSWIHGMIQGSIPTH